MPVDERNPGQNPPGGPPGVNPTGPLTFGGFTFGRPRFGQVPVTTLQRIAQILGTIPNLQGLTGPGGQQLFRGRLVRAGDIRRLLRHGGEGLFAAPDRAFLEQFLGTLPPGPGFSGFDEAGNFIFAPGILDVLQGDRELNRLVSILSQRPNKVQNLFKGGQVNFPDLRRLFNALQVGQARDFIQDILVRARNAGVDDVSQQQAVDTGGGGPAGGGGPGGGERIGGGDSAGLAGIEGGGIPRDFPGSLIPPQLEEALVNQLLGIFESPGIDSGVLRGARNQIRGESKNTLISSLGRGEERLAARGLLDSGLGERALQDIESDNLSRRQSALSGLDLQNALFANQALNTALSGTFGLGNLNLGGAGLSLDAFLGQGGLALGQQELALRELLGMRGLDLQEFGLLSDLWLQELLANLQLGALAGNQGFF